MIILKEEKNRKELKQSREKSAVKNDERVSIFTLK
jgi:hypothetical protein